MINREYMMSQMEFFLNNMRQIKIDGFLAGQEFCNFSPEVGLYNIAGKPIAVVGTEIDDKKAHRKAVMKLIRKHKAVATLTVADVMFWDKDAILVGEHLIVWVESSLDHINGLGMHQAYTLNRGHLKFDKIETFEDMEPVVGGFGGFFKKY